MEYICGITFAPFAARGRFATDETKKSLVLMRERTAANFVIFVPNGVQQTAQSEEICYTVSATMSDDVCSMCKERLGAGNGALVLGRRTLSL